MSIPWLADVLRGAGVAVVEEGDWRSRTRSGSFAPVGVLWHHTAATSSASNPAPSLSIVITGRSDLPGPLCHALVDYNGVFHLIAAGRANHAGESRTSGPIPAGDGNSLLIGWEIDYQGVTQSITAAQYQASLKATAAVLRYLGRDASYARGHRETSITGKIDPGGVDLDRMRADVAVLLTGGVTGAISKPTAVSFDNKLHWAWRKTDGGVWATTWLGAQFQGPTYLGKVTSDAAMVAYATSVELFATTGGQVVKSTRSNATGWPALTTLGNGGASLVGRPTAIGLGLELALFARSADNRLWKRSFFQGAADWSPWSAFAGTGQTAYADPVGMVHRGQMHVFTTTASGAVLDYVWDPAAQTWTTVALPTSSGVVRQAAVSYGTELALFSLNAQGQIWKSSNFGSGWTAFSYLGPGTADIAATAYNGGMEVITLSTVGDVLKQTWSPTAGWTAGNLGGGSQYRFGAVDVTVYGQQLTVLATAQDGQGTLYKNVWQPGQPNWTGFSRQQ